MLFTKSIYRNLVKVGFIINQKVHICFEMMQLFHIKERRIHLIENCIIKLNIYEELNLSLSERGRKKFEIFKTSVSFPKQRVPKKVL